MCDSHNGGGTHAPVLLSCPACGKTDTVWVKYKNCTQNASHELELPPQPAGHPAARSCPGTTSVSCSGTVTGTVLTCVDPVCPERYVAF